jgi:hypothetical protein
MGARFPSRQLPLQLAQSILGGLRGRALRYHSMHDGFLLRYGAFQPFDMLIRWVPAWHRNLLAPMHKTAALNIGFPGAYGRSINGRAANT